MYLNGYEIELALAINFVRAFSLYKYKDGFTLATESDTVIFATDGGEEVAYGSKPENVTIDDIRSTAERIFSNTKNPVKVKYIPLNKTKHVYGDTRVIMVYVRTRDPMFVRTVAITLKQELGLD